MQAVRFVKAHPVATVVLLAVGAIGLPSALSFVGAKTGVNVSLPTVGGGS
jgi:hypothetical protein